MKKLFKLSSVLFMAGALATACQHSASTSSATNDTTSANAAPRDVTESDTQKVDTTKPAGTHVQGSGHPRGGMQ